MAKKMRILSIDGGGIRGLIPASVLVQFERMLGVRSGDPNARISDYFDLVAGTSTGGLLTCLLLEPASRHPTPGAPDLRRPKRRAQDVVNFYRSNGAALFRRSAFQKMRRTGAILDERYGSTGLKSVLEQTLGRPGHNEVMLSELLRPTVIPTYDASTGDPYFFKQHVAASAQGRDFSVRAVALATSAAPTVFETAEVEYDGRTRACVDGGVFASNPTMCAYAEAHSHFAFGARDMAILSLGTGSSAQTYSHRQMRNWGVAKWVKPVLDMMMEGSARTVDYQIKQIFSTLGTAGPEQYLRVQPMLPASDPRLSKMDNVAPENLKRLVDIGRSAFERDRPRLEKFIDTQLLGDSSAAEPATKGTRSDER